MRRARLTLLVLPVALAACGGGGTSSSHQTELSPVAYVRSAAKKTAQTASEHVGVKGSATLAGSLVTLSGNGDFDNEKTQGSLHLDCSAGGLGGSIEEVT